ncbi:MAG: FKBP-type peptidyl-prolyl cis-trans isomerase [Clostridia bacterium]|nr:FKBP-type peptidyl-prolyl cis-trans isomerase [Clostridia bacterium]
MKKTISIICTIIAIILIATAFAGCDKGNQPQPQQTNKPSSDSDILKGLNTYASYDVSYIDKLADYNNVTVTKNLTVTDEDVAQMYLDAITVIAQRNDFTADPPVIDGIYDELVKLVPAGIECKEGDIICFDYSGRTEEGPLTGGIAYYNYTMLGSGHFIPGFEESIVGHKAGTPFDITVTFPSSYPQNRDLENKDVTFEILIHHILPGLSDESAKLLSDAEKRNFDETKTDDSEEFTPSYTTAAEYRQYITGELTRDREQSFEDNLESTIMYKLYTESTFKELPQIEIDSFKRSVEDAARTYGVTTEVYLYYAYGGLSSEEDFNELARYQVATKGIMSAICQNEKFTLSQAEFDEKAALIAENYNYESPKQLVEEVGIENVCNSIIIEFVLDYLKEHVSVVTE